MLEKMRSFSLRAGVVVASLAAPVAAFATTTTTSTPTIDVSGATGLISGDMTTAIAAVGGALITAAAVAVGFKWVKGMLFS